MFFSFLGVRVIIGTDIELSSASTASEPGYPHRTVTASASCTLTRHEAPFFGSSGNSPGRVDLAVPLDIVAWMNLLNLSALGKEELLGPLGKL